jgi:uncharacterized protein YkwD
MLVPEAALSLTADTTPRNGQLNRNNPLDIYQFRIKNRSSLNVQLNSSDVTNAELIKDHNRNGRVDRGEVVAKAKATIGRSNAIQLNAVDRGTYFLRVSSTSGRNLNYSLVPQITESKTPRSGNSFIDEVVKLTNQFRRRNGLKPLTQNAKLTEAAQLHSQNMGVQDFFDHYGRDGSTPFQRITAAGYQYFFAGENIAAGYFKPKEVMKGWIDSPGHRANLLNPNFKEIGVGYHYQAQDTGNINYFAYWTQNFGAGV